MIAGRREALTVRGDPWAPARYRLTLNNVVYLEGSLRNPDTTIADATWIPIFQLPESATTRMRRSET